MLCIAKKFLFCSFFASCLQIVVSNKRVVRQTDGSEQPRIVTTDGHLIFQTGANHNITFQSSPGGSVTIDGQDVGEMMRLVQDNQAAIQTLPQLTSRLNTLTNTVNAVNRTTSNNVNRISTISGQMDTLRGRVSAAEGRMNATADQVTNLRNDFSSVTQKLIFDNCGARPCQNGGSCLDMYDTYRCFCPYNWQGTNCDQDVNECANNAGMPGQGCAAGSTCLNTNGGFTCVCPTSMTGVLCNVPIGGCDRGSNQELCGHGTCVQSGQGSQMCMCDDGWTYDTGNPKRCTVDINECALANKPCSDLVQCINLNGAYMCGPCPAGYTGNGHQCTDVNECLNMNGGCSTNPMVQCVNNVGSRTCGPCPGGYEGNGQVCVWVGYCRNNNGGCHPSAQCIEYPGLNRMCRCNPGYEGNGEGSNGCVSTGTAPTTPCNPNPCVHGTCYSQTNSNAFTCTCAAGWSGPTCSNDINECAVATTCQNGGTCTNTAGNYSCQCSEFYRGRNCENLAYACGGNLNGVSGTFQFPPSLNRSYPHDISCAWRITTDLNKVLKVNFTLFDIEAASDCNFDFLQIHDGPSASSQLIGKYCGTSLQGQLITTTHNMIYMWFKTDASVARAGFAVVWTSETPVCGGDIRNATYGTITSPGYPGNYPVNRTCIWTIRVPAGNDIQFTFGDVDIELHSNCSFDYLEIRNGLSESDRVLSRLCSRSSPAPLQTEGNEAFIKFHSDPSLSGKGFSINWSNISTRVPGCGGRFNDTDGYITSPNYPNNYNHQGDCVWTINVPLGERIRLTFQVMNMEGEANCPFDSLTINDGRDELAPPIGRYCGTTLPAPITSSGNVLYLRFRSDGSVSAQGFMAQYTVACGGNFTQPTGELISPYFPNSYPHVKDCYYRISAPQNRIIKVTFMYFNLEVGSSPDTCDNDYLAAYNGESDRSSVIGRYCGSAAPTPLISTGNFMYLQFHSDASIAGGGFRARYEFAQSPTSPGDCGGILSDDHGVLTSPGHPDVYPHGVSCLWEIRAQPGFQIRLTFNFFSLESTSNCQYDYVQILNNATDNSTTKRKEPTLIRTPRAALPVQPKYIQNRGKPFSNDTVGPNRRYCGSALPPVQTSIDSVLYVFFKSDSSIAHEGFSASWVTFNNTWCGEERRTLPGLLTSPNYPSNYPHQRECIWTIVAPENHQILLNITDFSMEYHTNCQYDYLEIRNGGFSTSPLVGTFCGNTIDSPIIAHSNRVWIKFVTDASQSGRGFSIWYEDAGEGCGADMTSTSGTFLSPNYPSPYGRNAECYWTITVSQGSSITLVFVDIDIEQHPACQYDYVEAINGLHTGNSLGRFCGSSPPQPIISSDNQMTVKFRTDFSMAGRGFHAAYYGDCRNRILTARQGVIESPNFPDPYEHSKNCSWIIQSSGGSIINVAFSHMQLETHSNCMYDWLEIRNGNSPLGDLIGRYCGQTNLPAPVNSSTNALYITFNSDASLAFNGFRLEYNVIGCGADFSSETGEFRSPNYPNQYPHNIECIWTVTVPVGKSINLTVYGLNMESSPNCAFDYLQVFGGPDELSPSLVKLCQTDGSTYQLASTGNQMYIKMKTDVSSAGTGFRATFASVAGGCGGTYTAPSGTLTSKNYPSPYPHNTNCEWKIMVQEFQTVQINFTDFLVESAVNCTYDFVAVYDGLDDNAPILARLCGSNITNKVFISSSNTMRIRMVTDASSSGKGFMATYRSACGGRKVVTNDIGTIRSPNFPSNYDANSNCTWILIGPQAVDRITLQFTALDLEVDSGCLLDYILILQGDNLNAPQERRLCGTTLPASITSLGNALTVVFRTDASIQQSGFSASFSKSTSFCGGNLTSLTGAFSTPNYPNNYPANSECIWFINAAPGNLIAMSFGTFNLENSCSRDYVEVRDGSNLNTVLGRFCGNTIPNNLTAAHSLYIKFRSDAANSGSGFVAQFNTLPGGDLTGDTGQLASPLYPRPYPNNLEYKWTITVSQNKKVRIQFTEIDVEANNCAYDYVQFFDGPTRQSPELGKFCGTSLPAVFSSTGNQISVVFKTDLSSSGRGFLLSWSAVDVIITTPRPQINGSTTVAPGTCTFNLAAMDVPQNLTSPNYPSNYPNSALCTWTIRSANGERIKINVTNIDLEANSNCAFDKLAVYDGEVVTPVKLLGQLCARGGGFTFVSTGGSMTLRFTSDSTVTRMGFVVEFAKTCGGTFTASTGRITTPGYPAAYPVNANCTWVIQVLTGRTIEFYFDSFNLAPANVNCTDRLRILNGGNRQSPDLVNGTSSFCGSVNPSPTGQRKVTTSRFLFLEFISDGDASGGFTGFQMNYAEKRLSCGGSLTLTDIQSQKTLLSPNFEAGSYPHNVDCSWVITAPAGERVQLDFPAFDLEKHSDCRYDFVMVRDGGTENSPQLSRLCGSDTVPSLKSTSNIMFIRLITDDSVAGRGFNITYKIATCGGTLAGTSGLITSPLYPSSYPPRSSCEWFIQGPIGHYIGLNFTDFRLGSAPRTDCSGQDSLKFFNRNINGTVTTLIGEYCGNRAPSLVRSVDSRAYILFTSNDATSYPGFSLNFYASVEACGGDLVTPSGAFTSPNYPGQYPHSRACYWKITVAADRRITLRFDDLNLEDQSQCLFDYVEVRNGYLDASPTLGRVCGANRTSTVFKSTGNTMYVTFVTDGSVSNGGFSASYTSLEPAVCGGLIVGTPGTVGSISSPGFSFYQNVSGAFYGNYSNNQQCVWVLRGGSGVNNSILLTFSEASWRLEPDGECRYDFLEIREGTTDKGRLVGKFCGNDSQSVPRRRAIAADSVWLSFISDGTITHEGFNMTYTLSRCGGIIQSDSGVITSPNYPNFYNHNDGCAWEIVSTEGTQIEIRVDDIDVETVPKCGYDSVSIYNGGSAVSPLIASICSASSRNSTYLSSSNRMRVEFVTDSNSNGRGFRMSWRIKQQGCGGIFHGQSGQITSPNYPNRYPNNIECVWDIFVQDGYFVRFNVSAPFDIEAGESQCYYDYLLVQSVQLDGTVTDLGRFCGHETPPSLRSQENHLRVKMRTDPWTTGNGFLASWTAGCGGTFGEPTGVIQSPGWPENYGNNLTCDYFVAALPEQFVVLQFDSNFRIERGSTCQYDSVSVFNNNATGALVGKFCGTTAPQALASRGQMMLRFKTDGDTTDRGWRATYLISDCGGHFNASSGQIKTPTHPADYQNNLNCTWYISVAANMSVRLRFESFDVESSANGACMYDYLSAYDGPSTSSNMMGRYCGNFIPGEIRTTSSYLTLNFRSDGSVTKKGFLVVYDTTYGVLQGCGGILNSSAGTIVPVRVSNGMYANSLNCIWTIMVPDTKIISVAISNISIEADDTCDYDGLEIIDGISATDPALSPVICGNYASSRQFTTASNVLRVRFYSDSSIQLTGFSLVYTAIDPLCGGVATATNLDQQIQSPNFGAAPMVPSLTCRWTISAPANQKVRITVTSFGLPTSATCLNDFLQLRDVVSSVQDLNGQDYKFCGSELPPVFDSQGRDVQVNFKFSGSSSAMTGFRLSYTIATCNRTFTGLDGQLLSPNWPSPYPASLRCVMTISVPANNVITLYFNRFAMEAGMNCTYDSLEIRDGLSPNATSLARLCGTSIPLPLTSTSNNVRIALLTDSSLSGEGFFITYVASPTGCGGKLTALSGGFASPVNVGSSGITCVWQIELSVSRFQPKLLFNVMNLLQNSTGCPNSYVEVRDGGAADSPLVGRYCNDIPALITATSNKLYVKFSTNQPLVGGARFKAFYDIRAPSVSANQATDGISRSLPLLSQLIGRRTEDFQ